MGRRAKNKQGDPTPIVDRETTSRPSQKKLGKRKAEIAALPVQQERRELWRRLNQLDSVRPMVYVMGGDDRLEFRPVSVMRRRPDSVLINGGLNDGDRVVVSAMPTAIDCTTSSSDTYPRRHGRISSARHMGRDWRIKSYG